MEPVFANTIAELMLASLFMISLIAFARVFWRSSRGGAAEQLVRSVSDRSVAEVAHRLQSDMATMSAAELRGYVRARATSVVRHQANLVAAELGKSMPEEIVTRALERVVHLVMRQQMTTPATRAAVRAG